MGDRSQAAPQNCAGAADRSGSGDDARMPSGCGRLGAWHADSSRWKRRLHQLPAGRSGAVTPETGRYVKRLSELKGIYQDQAAFARAVADGDDPVAYEVIDYRHKESDLSFGTTIMSPGKVGGEYFMTRGHYHERPE